MWRRVELRNYRSIEHVKVDLAPFTLLVGPNGSGKSNFADALVFVRDVAFDAATAVERRGGIREIRRRTADKVPPDVMLDVRVARSVDTLDTDYFRHEFVLGRVSRQRAWGFRRETIEISSSSKVRFRLDRNRRELSLKPSNWDFPVIDDMSSAMVDARHFRLVAKNESLRMVRRLRLEPQSMDKPQPILDDNRLDEKGSNIAAAYESLEDSAKTHVLAAMRKIIPGLIELVVQELDGYSFLRFRQRQQEDSEATFPASSMSEGALRALGILVAAQQIRPDELLIIEEPEVSIHVGAAQLLFDVLKRASERGAVLVTTHSADLLDAAKDEEILVCAYRDGVTKIGPLASEQRAVVKEGLFSVAELMRSEPLRIEGEPIPAVEP